MEGLFNLFEALASNGYIIFIIIAGIIGFLKNSSNKQKEEQQKRPNKSPRSRTAPSGGKPKQKVYVDNEADRVYTSSIEDKQNEQMEQLANRYRTSGDQSMKDLEHSAFNDLSKSEIDLSQKRSHLKREIGSNLEGKRLINGIILSEVLGPPRAQKPYRSIVSQRRK
ncbi:hypothetical protein CIL03_01970 [Virgibacillus indicus]|uniref:Uncharacterized protein n=1 Tax=Virgibacillus indicus TaxID=2024554 RepID=A0A265ND05_9BACI|nr:hypothetical protein [Virgibacillus indicus]OZU89930.1 hypothetical protein CIL03_01970 [Virgibacillus indicus]